MHGPASRRYRHRHLPRFQQPNLVQEHARPLRFVLELPLAGFELGIFKLVRSARIKDRAFPQDAVYEPALFQFECLAAKGLSFVLVNRHAQKYKRAVTSFSPLLC